MIFEKNLYEYDSNLTLSQVLHFDEDWEVIGITEQLEKVEYIARHSGGDIKEIAWFILEVFEEDIFDIEIRYFNILEMLNNLPANFTGKDVENIQWYLEGNERFEKYKIKELKNAW